jgi:hypothetical protein
MNPLKEVQKFFERYHKDHFRIYNLCPSEFSGYSPEKFNNCVVRYPVPDDAVPSMQVRLTLLYSPSLLLQLLFILKPPMVPTRSTF